MIYPYEGKWPEIHESVFLAPSSDAIGDLEILEDSSLWFQTLVRADVNSIRIGRRTNIQDHSTLHVTRKTAPLSIGDDVTVGHRVLLHGCTVGNRVLVGMGSILMDHVEIADDTVVGAGSLVTEGKRFPSGVLVMGSPARVIRELKAEELAFLRISAENYVKDSREYKKIFPAAARFEVL